VQLDTQLKRVEAMTMHHADLTEQANCAKLELEAYKTNESHKSTLDGLTAIINALQKQLDLKDAELRKYKVRCWMEQRCSYGCPGRTRGHDLVMLVLLLLSWRCCCCMLLPWLCWTSANGVWGCLEASQT
jgi:hypothetical protein